MVQNYEVIKQKFGILHIDIRRSILQMCSWPNNYSSLFISRTRKITRIKLSFMRVNGQFEYLSFLGFLNCVLMDYYMILKLNKIDKYKFFIVSIHLTNTNGISFINEICVLSWFLYLMCPFNLQVDILCSKFHSFIQSHSLQFNVIVAILLQQLFCILVYPFVVRTEHQ